MVQHGVAHQNGKYCVRKELNTSSDKSANQQKQHKTSPTFFLSTHAHTQRGANNDANKDNLIWFSSALAPHTTRSFPPERHGTSMKGKSEIIWKSNNSNKKKLLCSVFFRKKRAFMVYAMRQFGGVADEDEAAPALKIFDGEECETFGKFENFLSRCPPPPTSFVYTHKRRQRPERDEVPCSVKDEVSLSRIQQLFFSPFSIIFHLLRFTAASSLPSVWVQCEQERERKGAEKSIVSWACVGNKFSPKKHIQPRCSCCYVCVSWAAGKKTIFSVTPTYRTRWTQHFPVQLVCCVGRVLFHVALSLCEYVKERERIVGARCVRLKWKWKCLHSSHTQKTLRSSCTPKLQHFPTYNKALHSILVIVILPPNWRHFCFQRHKKTFLSCLPPFSTSTFDSALIRISFLFLLFREKISRSKSPA